MRLLGRIRYTHFLRFHIAKVDERDCVKNFQCIYINIAVDIWPWK